MIKSGDLRNRMADPKGSEAVQADIQRMKGRKPDPPDNAALDPLAVLRDELAARFAAARDLVPPRDDQLHCGHCWGEGRDAAIRAIEAEGGR